MGERKKGGPADIMDAQGITVGRVTRMTVRR